jgi:hypothetical protein
VLCEFYIGEILSRGQKEQPKDENSPENSGFEKKDPKDHMDQI